jgi:transcriptional regulator with XRE-family HTH domain
MQTPFPFEREMQATIPAVEWEDDGMPREKKHEVEGTFGARLAELRKAAGYTQTEFAVEIGVSQRMVAYYEGPHSNPPASMLAMMAKALRISIDELVGAVRPGKKTARPQNSRLQRRLQQLEKLSTPEKRQILQFLDTFLDRERLRQRMEAGGR